MAEKRAAGEGLFTLFLPGSVLGLVAGVFIGVYVVPLLRASGGPAREVIVPTGDVGGQAVQDQSQPPAPGPGSAAPAADDQPELEGAADPVEDASPEDAADAGESPDGG